jgi:cation/acetate symporter
MATGADWMSAASFIGMAGTLYLSGYGGLAFIMGWTGGYCLVALFLAPYLRKFGQFTIPDFLGARYEGNLPRLIGIFAAILCSFTYVVAQIYGVGLITTRLSGLAFEIGIFVGLGGILVCSFLGGMRAVTWTQVAQYIILIIAYMIPLVWLSVKQTGVPIPQAVYGYQLQKVTAAEKQADRPIRRRRRSCHLQGQGRRVRRQAQGRARCHGRRQGCRREEAGRPEGCQWPVADIQAAEKALASCRPTWQRPRRPGQQAKAANEARAKPLAGMPPHATQFAGDPNGDEKARKTFDESRRNFLALIFCLMVGTAALPHILMRYYTTPSVKEARESVTWSLFFIFLLYFSAPALAVLVKYEIFSVLVGTPFDKLPGWIANWTRVDPGLLSVVDINKDGIFQLGEMKIGGDIIVLATPEIGGLPYVVSGMVAAGGLAAALSTADGLLLTIANALSHDLYYKMIDPNAPTSAPRGHLQGPAAGRGTVGCLGGGAEAGGHPVPGLGGVLVRGGGVLPGAGAAASSGSAPTSGVRRWA